MPYALRFPLARMAAVLLLSAVVSPEALAAWRATEKQPADAVESRSVIRQITVPLKRNKNALIVDAQLTHGESYSTGAFIIDTGATYTSISQEMAGQLGIDLRHCEKILITTANGRIEVPRITIQNLSVNGLEVRNVEATVIPVRRGASFSGLLGLSFIRQFVVTIDPYTNQLIFRRN